MCTMPPPPPHTHTHFLRASPNVPSVHAFLGLMSAGKYTCTVVIPLDFFQQALLINKGCNVHLYNKKRLQNYHENWHG